VYLQLSTEKSALRFLVAGRAAGLARLCLAWSSAGQMLIGHLNYQTFPNLADFSDGSLAVTGQSTHNDFLIGVKNIARPLRSRRAE